ncbi:palmitoyltransferase, putative (DHHC10) [Plasmodium ovale curtisi]|uniref:Palmitoyltransferase, putative (DHHC10) n=1 Tax=Plasmodium ovale curtisi TaxID=864141 RepID=A0A1A8VZ38_PLAOA|nr:palmitoyltransferase, putative (DHHC10) [Plasmodium ovale curtisi]SBS84133.1 palmitoyltransferase, putative (DHHC10) [Plasmodium ovale curtisi]
MKGSNDSQNGIRHLLPVMLIGLVTLVMYTIFFYCMVLLQINVEKQYVDRDLLKEGYTKLITFHILLFLLIWSFYKTYKNKGTGKNGLYSQTVELIKMLPLQSYWLRENYVTVCTRKSTSLTGPITAGYICTPTCVYKKECAEDGPLLSMGGDDSSFWKSCSHAVANCVGFYNYKFFLLSLFYANLCCFYVEINCHSSFPNFYSNPNIRERNKRNMYDLGVEENFKQVMGENILFWLLPVGKPKGDGLFYRTYEV